MSLDDTASLVRSDGSAARDLLDDAAQSDTALTVQFNDRMTIWTRPA
ncbi:MAG: hypothetical protein JWO51_2549 [Rhodospirillales bacterium]|nr:hypothetical protein [Rhodospirillales bacterium]